MRGLKTAITAVAVVAATGSSGADRQGLTPVDMSFEQAVDDYNFTSIFDAPIQYMPKECAFDFIRRAANQTRKERVLGYVPGKLVLLGKGTDSSGSVKANMVRLAPFRSKRN